MNRIKELREAKGKTLAQMSDEIGVTDNNISRYEHDLRNPKLKTLCTIADYFGVSLDYLLGRTNERYVNKKAPLLEQRTLRS